uniref:Dynein heavy chain C-terminal domain-containing protein n=1 Tax=Phaeomonas parva TaxID=124430 RepID=A0A7S1U752_9STRA
MLKAVMVTESSEGGGGGGGDREAMILTVASDIASRLPEMYDMEAAQIKYPVRWDESMNTVLCQELQRFNNLTALVRKSLHTIQKAVKGLVVMSVELDKLGSDLFFGRIPVMWKPKSYPSLKALGGYVSDLLLRLSFFNDWFTDKPPAVYWISSFFFTQAFLTGAQQNFARKFTIPIDNVEFDYEVMPASSYRMPPEDGVYCRGMFLEGARWDMERMALAESQPKVLFSLAPIFWFQPKRSEELTTYPHYNCPLYKTPDRRGILKTTGHSSNFVMFVRVPAVEEQTFWVQRGVCALLDLQE